MSSIKINVGGTIFETTLQTLSVSSYFSAMWGERWKQDSKEIPFIDRNPRLFDHVLSLMRDPNYPFPEEYTSELDFFGIVLQEPAHRYRYISLNTFVITPSRRNPELTPISDLKSGDTIYSDKKGERKATIIGVKKNNFYHSNLVRYKGIILSAKRSLEEESGDEEMEIPLDQEPPKMREMVRPIVEGVDTILIFNLEGKKIMDFPVERG